MRYLVSLFLALALGVMGCSETTGTGGSGGGSGLGGDGGNGGSMGQVFPCSEQGIRDAIAEGGGPHKFSCDGPQTVVTEAPIEIDNAVVLDGEGNLTVDGNDDHEVFLVPEGVSAELHGLRVIGGHFAYVASPLRGAAVYNAGMLTMTSSTVSENEAGGSGTGVIVNLGTLVMTGVTVSGNTCDVCPALQNQGTLTMTNCTVSGNQGDVTGGIRTDGGGTLTVTNCTLSGHAGPALSMRERSTLSVANTIVDGVCAIDFTSGVASFGFNIESPGDTCRFHERDQVNVTAEQLNLGPLQDNGGPTETHALLTEPVVSVAIETAYCPWDETLDEPVPRDDQRGVIRPQAGWCDAGAFEREPESDACWPSGRDYCLSAETIEPIVEVCAIDVPDQPSVCEGTESVVNPASCASSGNTVTYKLNQMQVVPNCDTGYDLDGCQGATCLTSVIGPAEDGAGGIDNGLLFFDQFCISGKGEPCTPYDLGTLDQAFHDAICVGDIDIEIEIDAGAEQSCAVVAVSAGGESGDPIPMNLSGEGCLSGTLGALPIQLGNGQGTIDNAVVRMTVSPAGLSDGILGGTVQGATAEAIVDAIAPGLSAAAPQFFDINADLSGEAQTSCDALSLTLEIGGSAIQVQQGGP